MIRATSHKRTWLLEGWSLKSCSLSRTSPLTTSIRDQRVDFKNHSPQHNRRFKPRNIPWKDEV